MLRKIGIIQRTSGIEWTCIVLSFVAWAAVDTMFAMAGVDSILFMERVPHTSVPVPFASAGMLTAIVLLLVFQAHVWLRGDSSLQAAALEYAREFVQSGEYAGGCSCGISVLGSVGVPDSVARAARGLAIHDHWFAPWAMVVVDGDGAPVSRLSLLRCVPDVIEVRGIGSVAPWLLVVLRHPTRRAR